MKLTIAGLLVLGLVAAISAAVLISGLGAPRVVEREAEPAAPEEARIVVASRPLPAMTRVQAADIGMTTVAVSEMPQGALRSEQSAIGKVLLTPMVDGEAFTRNKFAREGSGVHLAAVLERGERAMSVSLPDHSGLEGLLYPGAYVDVLASFRPPGEVEGTRSREMISTVLFEKIQVLAVEDQTIVSGEPDATNPEQRRSASRRKLVTLLVSTRQAEALQLAMSQGEISLALRNPLDDSEPFAGGTWISDISPLHGDRPRRRVGPPIPAETPREVARAEPTFPPDVDPVTQPEEPSPEPKPEPKPDPEPAKAAEARWRTIEVYRGRSRTEYQYVEDDRTVEPRPR